MVSEFSVFDEKSAVLTSGFGDALREDVVFPEESWFFSMHDVVAEELNLGGGDGFSGDGIGDVEELAALDIFFDHGDGIDPDHGVVGNTILEFGGDEVGTGFGNGHSE